MYKIGGLSKIVAGALALTVSCILWANKDLSTNHIDKLQQVKEFKLNSVAGVNDLLSVSNQNSANTQSSARTANGSKSRPTKKHGSFGPRRFGRH